jgi:hypothetical protein
MFNRAKILNRSPTSVSRFVDLLYMRISPIVKKNPSHVEICIHAMTAVAEYWELFDVYR